MFPNRQQTLLLIVITINLLVHENEGKNKITDINNSFVAINKGCPISPLPTIKMKRSKTV